MPILGTLADIRDIFIIIYGTLGIIFFVVGIVVAVIIGMSVKSLIGTVKDMVEDPHYQARGMFEEVEVGGRPLKIPAMSPRLSGTPGGTEWPGPSVGSHNAEVLKKAGVKYVVLYRDLRDVAISYHFYVKGTPWHPEHARHKDADLQQGLRVFAERMLDGYVEWVRSWEKNRDPVNSLAFKYEDMLKDANGVMMQIARHYQLSADEAEIKRIVEANSFQNLSKGRAQGQESGQSFFRKGVAGDWRNQFSPELREVYKKKIGAFLIEAGCERDMSW